MMGLALNQDDRDSDKDSDPVKAALWALEGKVSKSPRNSFGNRVSKVEIPDLESPDFERSDCRRPLAHNTSLAGKRDSFGKLLASSSSCSKVELGPLLEEEEEEEENISPSSLVLTPPPMAKPRPQNLTLRPYPVVSNSLPTPSATPSPRTGGLKSLTLVNSPPIVASPSPLGTSARRSSLSGPPATTRDRAPARQSSISYKRSAESERSPSPTRLPALSSPLFETLSPEINGPMPITPEMSPSRRAFIYQSHSALLTRISDLEKLLEMRFSPSRSPSPLPPLSPTTTSSNDEFLCLVADLKAERDELKRDVEGWRTRVADLEKQTSLLVNRVETERRESWIIKEQLGVLQVEKVGMAQDAERLKATIAKLTKQAEELTAELVQQQRENMKMKAELARLNAPLALEPNRLRFAARSSLQSIDSQSSTSTTDVEDFIRSPLTEVFNAACLKLKVVQEEQEEPDLGGDESRDSCLDSGAEELAHYEDEDDSDISFYSPSRADSISSVKNLESPPASATPLAAQTFVSAPAIDRSASPSHERKSSLSKVWTFPTTPVSRNHLQKPAEVDKFFTCLEDASDQTDTDGTDVDDDTHDLGRPKLGFGFGHGFDYSVEDEEEEDMPPFVLPTQTRSMPTLGIVVEDGDEDEVVPFTFPLKKPLQVSVTPSSHQPPKPASLHFQAPVSNPNNARTPSQVFTASPACETKIPSKGPVSRLRIVPPKPPFSVLADIQRAGDSHTSTKDQGPVLSNARNTKSAFNSISLLDAPVQSSNRVLASGALPVSQFPSSSRASYIPQRSAAFPVGLPRSSSATSLDSDSTVSSSPSSASSLALRLSSFTSLLPWSPRSAEAPMIADTSPQVVAVTRERQVDRLRNEMVDTSIRRWKKIDHYERCAQCHNNGPSILL